MVLKGAPTVTASPDGVATLNPTGNPGLATAGTGDVLTGVIAGLAPQGLGPYDAARLGVYVHGMAGDLVAEARGQHGLNAGDVLEESPRRCSSSSESRRRARTPLAGVPKVRVQGSDERLARRVAKTSVARSDEDTRQLVFSDLAIERGA